MPGVVAHGIAGRNDLPRSVWMFGYGAAAVVALTVGGLALLLGG